MEKDNNAVLPFSSEKQLAVIGHMMSSQSFYLQMIHHVKESWFTNAYAGNIIKLLLSFHSRYNRCPSKQDFLADNGGFRTFEPIASRDKIANTLNSCFSMSAQIGLDTILPELTIWAKHRLMIESVSKIVSLSNSKKIEEAWDEARVAVKKSDEVVFSAGREESMDYHSLVGSEATKLKYDSAATFGLGMMDELLLEGQTRGGLMMGDTTVLLAPTNVGKTTSMLTVACANIKAGNPVFLMTHEGRPDDIKEKLWCCYIGTTRRELHNMYQRSAKGGVKSKKLMDEALAMFNDYLLYVPMNRAGLTVEEVEPVIRRKTEEWAAKHRGETIKLFVNDYPAKLQTKLAAKGRLDRRHIDDIVYNYFVQFGLELNFHVLSAIQTNRAGSKVNRDVGENRLLTIEDVAESFGPMQAVSNVISINRDHRAEQQGRVTFYICKSRSSETGVAVCCRSAYDKARTHGDDLGAVWYKHHSVMGERMEALLNTYRGGQIPLKEFDLGSKEKGRLPRPKF